MENNGYKIALMIDSENVSPKYIKPVMNEIAKYGKNRHCTILWRY